MDPITAALVGWFLGCLILFLADAGKVALHRCRMAQKQRRIVASRAEGPVPRLIIPESVPIGAPSCSHPTSQLVDVRSDAFSRNELVATLCLACDQQLGPEVWSTRKYEELEALTSDAEEVRQIRSGLSVDAYQKAKERAERSYRQLSSGEYVVDPRKAPRLPAVLPDGVEISTWGSDVPIRTARPEGRPFMEAHGADPVPIVIWAVAPEVDRPKAQLGEYGVVSDDERAWGFDESTPIRQTVQWRRVAPRFWYAGWPHSADRHTYSTWHGLGWRVDPTLDGVEKIRHVVVQLRHPQYPPVRLYFQHTNDYRRFLTS